MNKTFLNVAGTVPPTRKLFHVDPYQAECAATVVLVKDDLVVTDETIFYAESGGQVPDQGTIDGLPVIDVQKQGGITLVLRRSDIEVPPVAVNTFVVHRLGRPAPFRVGQRVSMALDWPRRYLHMRYHSASHFLYHAVRRLCRTEQGDPVTRGCYIHSESARFDYFDPVPGEAIARIDHMANELIELGAPIRMEKEPAADDLFYWTYGDIVIPCGGTHVRTAGEVGPITVKRTAKGRNNTRVYCYLSKSEAG
jgi:alanyl-tRNA synthetase